MADSRRAAGKFRRERFYISTFIVTFSYLKVGNKKLLCLLATLLCREKKKKTI
jgi:hypothetical protein